MSKYIYALLLVIILSIPSDTLAQSSEVISKAKVISILSEEDITIPGTDIVSKTQTIEAKIYTDTNEEKIVTFENDYILLDEGDKFFIGSTEQTNNETSFRVVERDRQGVLLFFVLLFVTTIIVFGKKQGVRSIVSLAGSICMLAYVLIPALTKGMPPVLVSTMVATIILFIAIYFTHGMKRESTVAFTGTVIAVILTGILSLIALKVCQFTGLGTEEASYLNIQSSVTLNFSGLLLGSIIIGVLGVLDDIAVTQVSIVRELYSSAPHLTKKEIYKKALRVGQEHVGALVNTLALAYTGASLPLLLLFSTSTYPLSVLLSSELFSVEIIRTIVGSIGLVLTVPITTLLAVYMLEQYRGITCDHSTHGHSH